MPGGLRACTGKERIRRIAEMLPIGGMKPYATVLPVVTQVQAKTAFLMEDGMAR